MNIKVDIKENLSKNLYTIKTLDEKIESQVKKLPYRDSNYFLFYKYDLNCFYFKKNSYIKIYHKEQFIGLGKITSINPLSLS